MSRPAPLPPSREAAASIPTGTLVGGRFAIEQATDRDVLGETLRARDEKTGKPIAVRILSPRFADPTSTDAIRSDVRTAAKLKHRSLVGTYGIGTHEGQCFVACEWVQGSPLSQLIAQRNAAGAALSARGAYNVIAHVCKALAEAHTATCHGALRPSTVWITKSGRVKVGELGVGLALARSGKWHLLPEDEQPFLAPEVRAGRGATPASDVFGVGALLYALLTGAAPRQPLIAASRLRSDLSGALDDVVSRCLSEDPTARFGSVDEVAEALLPLLSGTPEPDRLELGVELEIDVDVALSMAPPRPAATAPAAPAARPANPLAPAPTPPRRDPLAVSAPKPATPAPAPRPKPEADLAAISAKLFENDSPRWIAVKGGLDHGPFTARELVKLIVEGEVQEQHGLLNMSTGDRKPLGEWPQFREFVEQYKLRKAEADHTKALEKSTRIERTSNAAKFVILGGSLAVLVLAGGGYLMSRQAAQRRQAQHEIDLADMLDTGKVKISGTAGILQARPHGGGGGKRPGGSGGGERSTGFTSYDDAMNQAMELGDATKGGGERQLRTADIEAVMNRRLNSLFGCVSGELRGGSHLGNVQIDMAILGSGQVAGASISTGSPGFKRCIAAKVRQISFPSFPAPRMGARYSFGVD
ncbi:MAG: protein kinase [Polyangiales bacterium]